MLEPDDTELMGDGIDVTRVVFRVVDEFGNTQQFASGSLALTIDGPGEIIGENPFGLVGGAGAVWIKTKQSAGTSVSRRNINIWGRKSFEIQVTAAPA